MKNRDNPKTSQHYNNVYHSTAGSFCQLGSYYCMLTHKNDAPNHTHSQRGKSVKGTQKKLLLTEGG